MWGVCRRATCRRGRGRGRGCPDTARRDTRPARKKSKCRVCHAQWFAAEAKHEWICAWRADITDRAAGDAGASAYLGALFSRYTARYCRAIRSVQHMT